VRASVRVLEAGSFIRAERKGKKEEDKKGRRKGGGESIGKKGKEIRGKNVVHGLKKKKATAARGKRNNRMVCQDPEGESDELK